LAPSDTSAVSLGGAATAEARNPLLEVSQLCCGYGRKRVVFDVDLHVRECEIVALFGHNGAGKTTTIKTLLGMQAPQGGAVRYDGHVSTGWSSRRTVAAGMALIPSERFVFRDLTVLDNLKLGAGNARKGASQSANLARVYELFPILKERTSQIAGSMSGGQQRMVSLGMALMSSPRLLLLDEPSLGLAPAIVEQMFNALRELADGGLGVLLLEQNVGQALRIADRAYVMRSGRIILEESAEHMRARGSYWDLF